MIAVALNSWRKVLAIIEEIVQLAFQLGCRSRKGGTLPGPCVVTMKIEKLPPDITLELLSMLGARSLAVYSSASTTFRQIVDTEPVWRQTCLQAWSRKQHSAHMRRWMAEPAHATASSSRRLLRPKGPVGVAAAARSWKERYVFALQDRNRRRILQEELCEDASVNPADGTRYRRRWHLAMRNRPYYRVEDKEAVFRSHAGIGKRFNLRWFDRSLFEEVPWWPHRRDSSDVSDVDEIDELGLNGSLGNDGAEYIRIQPVPVLLRVGRTEDWGWTLSSAVSSAGEPREVVFTSRQLTAQQHRDSLETPPEFVTLYLSNISDTCSPCTLEGTWRCIEAYQGTMSSPTWCGSNFKIEPVDDRSGQMSVHIPDTDRQQMFKYTLSIGSMMRGLGDIDLQSTTFGPVHPGTWSRSPVTDDTGNTHMRGLVLVINLTMIYKEGFVGRRPQGIPRGLPAPLEVAKRNASAAATAVNGVANAVTLDTTNSDQIDNESGGSGWDLPDAVSVSSDGWDG